MTLTLPMAMIGEGGVKSGDAGREDGCSTWTWGRVDVVGTSSSTSCGPAGAGKGTGRFVPLMDPLAFAFKAGGVSTRTATPFPLAAQRARTGREGGGEGEAGGGVVERPTDPPWALQTLSISVHSFQIKCAHHRLSERPPAVQSCTRERWGVSPQSR